MDAIQNHTLGIIIEILKSTFEDPKNLIFFSIQMLMFGWGLIYLLSRIASLRKEASRLLSDFSDLHLGSTVKTQDIQKLNKVFKQHPFLERCWREFRETLVISSDLEAEVHNTVAADQFFSPEMIIRKKIHYSLISYLPAAMTALGLLGTFTGILVGVSSLTPEGGTPDLSKIGHLINGMKLAFSASLWGIFLALIFSLTEKTFIRRLSSKLHEIEDWFDDHFVKTTESSLLAKILIEQQQATASLKTFDTDLAGIISKSFESAFNTTMGEQFKQLVSSIEAIGKHSANHQMEGMDKLVGATMGHLNELMRGQLDSLATTIQELTSWHLKTKDQLEEIIRSFAAANSGVNSVSEGFVKHLTALTSFGGEANQFIDKIKSQTEDCLKAAESAAAAVNTSQEAVQKGLSVISEVKGAADSMKESQQLLAKTSGDFKAAFSAVNQELKSSLENYVSVTKGAIENFGSSFDIEVSKAVKQLAGAVHELDVALKSMPDDLASALATATDAKAEGKRIAG